jgi:hypothetical protein
MPRRATVQGQLEEPWTTERDNALGAAGDMLSSSQFNVTSTRILVRPPRAVIVPLYYSGNNSTARH